MARTTKSNNIGGLGNMHFGIGSGVICKSEDNSWYCWLVKLTNTILMVLFLFLIFYVIIFVIIPFIFSSNKKISKSSK